MTEAPISYDFTLKHIAKLQQEKFYGTLLIRFEEGRINLLNQQQSIKEENQLRTNYDANNNRQR